MKRKTAAAAAALGIALVLTGCQGGTHGDKGDPGRVIGRDYDPSYTTRAGKTRIHHPSDYDLTVRRSADGTEYDIDVSHDVYDHCYTGSSYPKCVKR